MENTRDKTSPTGHILKNQFPPLASAQVESFFNAAMLARWSNNMNNSTRKVSSTFHLIPTALISTMHYIPNRNCTEAYFELYIFYKSVGLFFISQVLIMATVGKKKINSS